MHVQVGVCPLRGTSGRLRYSTERLQGLRVVRDGGEPPRNQGVNEVLREDSTCV
jgi:hypothetical protein